MVVAASSIGYVFFIKEARWEDAEDGRGWWEEVWNLIEAGAGKKMLVSKEEWVIIVSLWKAVRDMAKETCCKFAEIGSSISDWLSESEYLS